MSRHARPHELGARVVIGTGFLQFVVDRSEAYRFRAMDGSVATHGERFNLNTAGGEIDRSAATAILELAVASVD